MQYNLYIMCYVCVLSTQFSYRVQGIFRLSHFDTCRVNFRKDKNVKPVILFRIR